eukprot:2768422-Prorocentrum_lima.AAC.1
MAEGTQYSQDVFASEDAQEATIVVLHKSASVFAQPARACLENMLNNDDLNPNYIHDRVRLHLLSFCATQL